MTYNTKTTSNTKQFDYGAYVFTTEDGQLAVANELNTRVIYTWDDGTVRKWATVKSLVRYKLHQKTKALRHYLAVSRVLKRARAV